MEQVDEVDESNQDRVSRLLEIAEKVVVLLDLGLSGEEDGGREDEELEALIAEYYKTLERIRESLLVQVRECPEPLETEKSAYLEFQRFRISARKIQVAHERIRQVLLGNSASLMTQ